MNSSEIPEKYTKSRIVHHWGDPYEVTPVVVDEPLGDGLCLIAIEPIMTRPDYYLVRIDSRWIGNELNDDDFHNHLDEICELIEDQFGEVENLSALLESEGQELDGHPELDWPCLDLNGGCSWWDIADLR